MKFTLATLTAALAAAIASAGNPHRRFAVLRFNGDGFLTSGRMDPIVSPGKASAHVHGVMGGSNFGLTVEGDQLLHSQCTNAKIKNDLSNYWFPILYFQDPKNGSLTPVPMFYTNIYYFFEATDDDIKAFPVGLKMLSGNAVTRVAPSSGGNLVLDPSQGNVQPAQWTCPRADNFAQPIYPPNSDGSTAGIQDSGNKGAGTGFPDVNCDGYASPLRGDLHFPSCYNPAAGLNDYKNNMAFPTAAADGKQNCPKDWIHTPHIFFEVYWNTPLFKDQWTQGQGSQPFVLANGDRTGFSFHGDFISGWDVNTLQTIIDTCDAGSSGMDKCPQIPGGLNDVQNCKIQNFVAESIGGVLEELPGNNPIVGWGVGDASSGGSANGGTTASAAAPAASYSAASPAAAPSSTDKAAAINVGGQKAAASAAASDEAVKAPVAHTTSLAAPATPSTSQASAVNEKASYVGSDGVSTEVIWEYVTIYQTKTVYGRDPEPTGSAQKKRQEHLHDHRGHMARHIRGGSSNRRR